MDQDLGHIRHLISKETRALLVKNRMGIEEIVMLSPEDLIRYKVNTEGDRLRLHKRCKELAKSNNNKRRGLELKDTGKRIKSPTLKADSNWKHDGQVMTVKHGGGQQKVDIDRKAAYVDVLEKLQSLYFPFGKSACGTELLDVSSHVAYFNGIRLDSIPGFTWGKFCEGRSKPIRIYLMTETLKMNGYEDYAATGADAAPADMYDPYSESKPFPSYHSDYPEDDYASRRGGGRGRGDRGGRGGGRRGGGDRDRGGGPFRRGGGGGGGRGGRGRPEKPAVSTKLYVTSLPDTCRRSDLIKLFEEYGRVVECDIVKHYAFIHFATQDEAKAAADGLNGHEFQGSSLKVELSISRVRQKPGMGGPNECYKCGKGGHWSKDCPTDRSSSRRSSRPLPYPEDDYYDRPPPPDPYYRDPYYRDRYPPPPHERYRPYADPYERRRYPPPPPYEDPYYRDPYARPPPEVYSRPPVARDPYYDYEDPYAASYQPHAAPFAAPQLAAPSYMAPHAEEAAQAQPAV